MTDLNFKKMKKSGEVHNDYILIKGQGCVNVNKNTF